MCLFLYLVRVLILTCFENYPVLTLVVNFFLYFGQQIHSINIFYAFV